MLARAARGGAAFANSPETARLRAERCRVGPFGTLKLDIGAVFTGAAGPRRSFDGMDRNLGLRSSPPDMLSREGLARRAIGRAAFWAAGGAFADVEEGVVEEKTGSRDAGRGRPLGRGICERSAIVVCLLFCWFAVLLFCWFAVSRLLAVVPRRGILGRPSVSQQKSSSIK